MMQDAEGGRDEKNAEMGSNKEWENMSEDGDEEDIVTSSNRLVRECEDRVKELEEELASVSNPNKKIVIMGQVHKAQRRLKDAILNLAAAKRIMDAKMGQHDKKRESNKVDEVIVLDDMDEDAGVLGTGDVGDFAVVDTTAVAGCNIEEAKGNKSPKDNDKGMRWGDMDSDDNETVVFQNHSLQYREGEWKTVGNKKANTRKTNKQQNTTDEKGRNDNSHEIKNPYVKEKNKTMHNEKETTVMSKEQSSLASFADKIKSRKRSPNANSVRVNMSFTPRMLGSEELKRIAREMLTYANEMDGNAMLLPWEDSEEYGPITLTL